jgi:hypothetical protein
VQSVEKYLLTQGRRRDNELPYIVFLLLTCLLKMAGQKIVMVTFLETSAADKGVYGLVNNLGMFKTHRTDIIVLIILHRIDSRTFFVLSN